MEVLLLRKNSKMLLEESQKCLLKLLERILLDHTEESWYKQALHKCLFMSKHMKIKRIERHIVVLSTNYTIAAVLETFWHESFVWIMEGTLQFMLCDLLSTKGIRISFKFSNNNFSQRQIIF